jgi:hypothetical protein
MSSILNLNDTTPAAGSGYQLAKWQRGSSPAGTDPTTGLPYFDVSTEVPNTGGTLKKTGNYTAVAADCGQLVSFNSGSPVTYTLPATPPTVGTNRWQVAVENMGAGALTISATTAAKLDGVTAGTLVLAQNSGCQLFTDGTDYFTHRGASPILVGDSGSGGISWTCACSGCGGWRGEEVAESDGRMAGDCRQRSRGSRVRCIGRRTLGGSCAGSRIKRRHDALSARGCDVGRRPAAASR